MTGRDYWAQSNANPVRRRAQIESRILEDRTGCWIWPGSKSVGGYGKMRAGSKEVIYVHRASYEMFVGPIPEGLQIDHLCRNRLCFNPEHLEPVTNRENVLRGQAPGAVAHRTNICVSGRHELVGENVVLRPQGWRQCRECLNEAQRRSYHRCKAAAKAGD